MPELEVPQVAQFAELFWSRTPEEDLTERDVDDDAGATIDSWRKFGSRDPAATQIWVENPQRSRDGWHSSHTVVRVMTPDMPFVVDSVLIALSHDGLITHHLSNVVFAVTRNDQGGIGQLGTQPDHGSGELFVYAEIDRVADGEMAALEDRLQQTLSDLHAIVGDFDAMKAQLEEIVNDIREAPPPLPADEIEENIAFLQWLGANNFTFLGYREFDYADGVMRQSGQSLGTLRLRTPASERHLSEQPAETQAFLLDKVGLAFSKSGTRSRVHRPAYPDYVGIKRFNAAGEVIGERGFLGLYTSHVYMEHPANIPVIRRKVEYVISRSNLDPDGFDGKVLAQVLATYPRDELFEIDQEQLFANAVAITYIHERRRTRVFTRYDQYGLFVNCLVYMPRDLFTTQSRTRVQELLTDTFDAQDSEYDAYISESTLVRLQFVLRVRPGTRNSVDPKQLEQKIAELTGDWVSELSGALITAFGETLGRRHGREYAQAFPAGYREHFAARLAVDDVASIEQLSANSRLLTRFYRQPEDPSEVLRLKVAHLGEPLPLSEIVPQLENMGLRALDMHPYRVGRASGPVVSIHDFELSFPGALDLGAAATRFDEAFVQICNGAIEDDGYNRLILAAGLSWRQVALLRTYALYMKQIRFGFSQSFIGDTLTKHPTLARLLVDYFETRFDPTTDGDTDAIRQRIELALESVELLNEDRILRRILELMSATARTSYYTNSPAGEPKPYLSMKLNSAAISNMPQPVPACEIFVNAPYFEGVHLRGGPIARGGLRWSDRLEDYRTEVLGLVKAQVVKNAVIVPTGAKGGFVLKTGRRNNPDATAVDCYREFISGLLDLTDNIVGGEVTAPMNVRRHDADDPYLVVAADKGTATFSDAANAVAADYGFWLGDGFASGGSNGYDHKKMGITARGAWVSVQRHFAERDIDVQRQSITVVGIGDMGGDVFGNGMLLSKAIKLVAAFNHLHIFIDPNPDPATSFAERQRLFAASAGWADYDTSQISAGGGVFPRQLKAIDLSDELRTLLAVDATQMTPDELIHAILKAPVQLIWNGGIGTYVKARGETHADADDRANDHLRVNADELRCDVFGEGGNLGLTQAARIEFALAGGALNTDFIDNSAGVDCSDHEVNIKIALDEIVAAEDMTSKQRNALLEAMTEEVAQLVLTNNARQVQTLSLAQRHSQTRQAEYQRFIHHMESEQRLDRELEVLPTDEALGERFGRGAGFTRPELAVLLAYAKIHIKQNLVQSNIHQDTLISNQATELFPNTLVERYNAALLNHRLMPEIVATELANDVVHHMGITFVTHLMDSVGGNVSEIVRAYFAAAESFSIRETCRAIEARAGVSEELKLELILEQIRLGRRVTRWIMRHQRQFSDTRQFIDTYKHRVRQLDEQRAQFPQTERSARFSQRTEQLCAAGLPEQLARECAAANDIAVALPIIDAADSAGADLLAVAQAYVALGHTLSFGWLTEQLTELPTSSHWRAMERDSLLDDVATHQSQLAAAVVKHANGDVSAWIHNNRIFSQSWQRTIEDVQHAATPDFSLYSMTERKLEDLCRGLVQEN